MDAQGSDIQSSIEEVNEVSRRIKVSIPASRVSREFNASLDKLMQTASVKGFRKGKAPRQMLEKLHGERLHYEIADKLVSSSLYDTVRTHAIEMVGAPKIDLSPLEHGKDLEYTAILDIFPRPEVKNYDSFDVSVTKRQVADSDVDQLVDRLRESKATPKKLEFRETAKKGDIVDVSVSVSISGETPSRPEPARFCLGEGDLSEEVEAQIEGMSITETKEINARTPKHLRDQKMRDRDALYRVTLNGLFEKVLPELNDEFAKSLGQGAETLLELRLKVRSSLEEEIEKQAKADTEVAVLEQLVTRNPFAVPDSLIDEEIRGLVVRSGVVDPNKVDVRRIPVEPFREGLQEIALKRVRSAILVDRIVEQDKVQVSDVELEGRIEEIASQNEVSAKDVRDYLSQDNRSMNLRHEMTRSRVIQLLIDRAKVTFVEVEARPEGAVQGK